jgi:hypothetical protein
MFTPLVDAVLAGNVALRVRAAPLFVAALLLFRSPHLFATLILPETALVINVALRVWAAPLFDIALLFGRPPLLTPSFLLDFALRGRAAPLLDGSLRFRIPSLFFTAFLFYISLFINGFSLPFFLLLNAVRFAAGVFFINPLMHFYHLWLMNNALLYGLSPVCISMAEVIRIFFKYRPVRVSDLGDPWMLIDPVCMAVISVENIGVS